MQKFQEDDPRFDVETHYVVNEETSESFDQGPRNEDERTWGTIAHASLYALLFGGVGMIVGPLIVYLLKKDDSVWVREQAKEALNFGITMTLALAASAILVMIVVGFIGLAIFGLMSLILPAIGAMNASKGTTYRYPATWRLIK